MLKKFSHFESFLITMLVIFNRKKKQVLLLLFFLSKYKNLQSALSQIKKKLKKTDLADSADFLINQADKNQKNCTEMKN